MSSSGPRRHLELVAGDKFENFNERPLDRLEFGELVTNTPP